MPVIHTGYKHGICNNKNLNEAFNKDDTLRP